MDIDYESTELKKCVLLLLTFPVTVCVRVRACIHVHTCLHVYDSVQEMKSYVFA